MKLLRRLKFAEATFIGFTVSMLIMYSYHYNEYDNYKNDSLDKFEGAFVSFEVTSKSSLTFMIQESNHNQKKSFYSSNRSSYEVFEGLSKLNKGENLIILAKWNEKLEQHHAYEIRTSDYSIYTYDELLNGFKERIFRYVYVAIFSSSCALILHLVRRFLTKKLMN